MVTNFYQIECKTHLHVGSGDSNYGVIDKLVQRDPTTEAPCIFASSLKGAFREYFKSINPTEVDNIFGKEDKSKVIFHQGFMLSIPVRSSLKPYFSMTAPSAIGELIDNLELIGDRTHSALIAELKAFSATMVTGKAVVYNQTMTGHKIEDYESNNIQNNTIYTPTALIIKLFGENIVMVDDTDYLEMVGDYRLPVIARNNLENGQSQNLWYEQIIPRESKFYFIVSATPGQDCTAFFNLFNEPKLIQIGANATIGYGLCKITKI